MNDKTRDVSVSGNELLASLKAADTASRRANAPNWDVLQQSILQAVAPYQAARKSTSLLRKLAMPVVALSAAAVLVFVLVARRSERTSGSGPTVAEQLHGGGESSDAKQPLVPAQAAVVMTDGEAIAIDDIDEAELDLLLLQEEIQQRRPLPDFEFGDGADSAAEHTLNDMSEQELDDAMRVIEELSKEG